MQKDRTSSHLYVSIRRPKVLEKIHLDVSNVSNLREQYIPADLVLYTMWLGGETWFINRRHWARRAVFDMWCECDMNLFAVAHFDSAIVRKRCIGCVHHDALRLPAYMYALVLPEANG